MDIVILTNFFLDPPIMETDNLDRGQGRGQGKKRPVFFLEDIIFLDPR